MNILNFFKNIFKNNVIETKMESLQKTYLNVPFKQKDIVKYLGAKWDLAQKQWFIPKGVDQTPFEKWLPCTTENLRADYFYLAQTYCECFKCHQQTLINALVLPEGFESLEEEEDFEAEYSEIPLSFCPNDFSSILAYVTYISPNALLEIQNLTNNYSLGYSHTVDLTYFMSKCQHCSSAQGDNFTINEHDTPFSPIYSEDFSKISFQRILTPIAVNSSCWTIDYPPLEYYLGDESANGLMYARNITSLK